MADHHTPQLTRDNASMHYLRELASLNYRFLGLLRTHPELGSRLHVSTALQTGLSALSEKSLRRLAACPYSLFDLHFDGAEAWKSLLSDPPPAPTSSTPRSRASYFSLASMLFARQLVKENADLGVLMLGISQPVVATLLNASVGSLMDRGDAATTMLRVRLINDPYFWPDLVNYVQEGTPQQYLAAQTSALQLMAARATGLSR